VLAPTLPPVHNILRKHLKAPCRSWPVTDN